MRRQLSILRKVWVWALSCVVLAWLTGCVSFGGARRALRESSRTEHLEIRFRPASKTAAEIEEVGQLAERELARMCQVFEVANDQTFTLFIFDSMADLHEVTRVPENVGGFATGHSGFFVLRDPALVHEMAHLVVRTRIGAPADDFLNEAMACTTFGAAKLAAFHAEAKYLLGQNRLPPLRELTGMQDIGKWMEAHPGVNLYHVGGSWLCFLLDLYGAEKVKRYYREGDASGAFGAPLDELETRWHAWLNNYRLRPEAEAALARLHADDPHTLTIMGDEMFNRAVAIPEKESGSAFHWEKDGKPIPGMTGAVLRFQPATVGDTGVYDLVATRTTGERMSGYRVGIRVIDPAIFLPADHP